MNNDTTAGLLAQIGDYKRKYYQNQLVKGIIFSAALLLSAYLFVNTLEYFGRFNSTLRGALLFGFLGVLAYALWLWVVTPLVGMAGLRKPLTDETAAAQIGQYFPQIGDKLLNTLQLQKLSGVQTDLIEASIRQKSKQLLIVRFSDAIKINENRRYLKYAAYPLAVIAAILLLNPQFFASSSDRIIHFRNNYNYAPFSFELKNTELKAFRNEDFTLNLVIAGNALPEAVYVVQNKAKFKLDAVDGRNFTYTFKNIQRPVDFRFEAAGYESADYKIQVAERPNLLSFDVTLNYPAYLGKPAEQLSNVGNLTVPEGTTVSWDFNTAATEEMSLQFDGEKATPAQSKLTGGYELEKKVRKSGSYQINLKNDDAPNREKISYFMNVIADKFPTLTLENYQDTTLYNYFMLGGNIADDYGFSNLRVFYNLRRKEDKSDSKKLAYKGFAIPFNKSTTNQTFYFQWYVDSLRLAPGDRIEYFVQVWDNDGVNGPKSAKSRTINFAVPSQDEVRKEIEKSAEKTEAQIEKTLNKTKNLQKELEKLDERLKSQKELDYQEKKQVEELLKKREELMNEIQSLQEQNKAAQEKQERFAQQNPELKQKLEQLQKLMNQLLDPETKKLYEQLEKMLEQKQPDDRMQELMNKLKNKEFNMQKEIERALEMFKKMQLEQKAEQIQKDLDKQAEKQEKLAEETEKNAENKDAEQKQDKNEDLKKEQEDLKKEFEKTKEDVKEMEKLNEEMSQPEDLDSDEEDQKEIEKEQENSSQELKKQESKKAAGAQKKAAKAMKKMSKKMGDMMAEAEEKEMEENMDDLRAILENLLKLSFDEERIMKDFRGVSQQDPRFVKLSQDQLKLKDDAKVIEDSLYALAKRVRQIETFVTRELNDMKFHIGESTRYIKERRLNMATSKQQFAMTSMNNLSLMLSQTLAQMQAQAMAMPGEGKGGKGKKGKKGKNPGTSLGELQKQLNEKMSKMQKDGKGSMGGRQMSEQVAKMAAEQAQIRQMLQQLLESQKGSEAEKQVGNEVKDLMKKMDETETDLVNKRINPELQKRQQDIVTRLLESEKALRQQEEDNKRKSETAKPIQRTPPPAFEQYVKDKQRQTELLRTVPPSFAPFYKREVDSYFKKYGSGGK